MAIDQETLIYNAMCLWEEITQPVNTSEPRPWEDMRANVGTAELRSMMARLAGPVEIAWQRAQDALARAERAHLAEQAAAAERMGLNSIRDLPAEWREANPGPQDPGSFDWEFIPVWLRLNVDWSGDEPRVKGGQDHG